MNKKHLPLYLLISCIVTIILFSIVAVAVPYFIKNMDMPTEYEKNTAWGRIFFINDKISYVPIDSIKYLSYQDKELFKNQGQIYAADITTLFTDYKARKITVLSDLYDRYSLQIWYHNGSVQFLDNLTYKKGKWVGNIASNDSIKVSQKINLGRVEGSGYSIGERIIDISGTYQNGFLILTACILIICFILHISIGTDKEWSMWAVLGLLGGTIGLLVRNLLYNDSSISETYIIEAIIALFCICEFGVICTLLSLIMTSKTENKDNDR